MAIELWSPYPYSTIAQPSSSATWSYFSLILCLIDFRNIRYSNRPRNASTTKIAYFGHFRGRFEYRPPRILESRSISPPLTCSVRCLLLTEISRATVLESTENGQFRLIRVPFPLEYEFRSTTLLFLHPLSCFEQLFRNFFIRTLWLSVRERNG